jgi:pilus assembly protein Flp/PilA
LLTAKLKPVRPCLQFLQILLSLVYWSKLRVEQVQLIKRFIADDSGATAVEYGMIVSVMSLAIVGGGNTVWVAIRDKFLFLGATVQSG